MRRKWAGIAIAVLVVAGVLLAAFFDWNWLRDPVASMVSKALDRRFAIHGDLAVDVSMTPRITMNQIELANTPCGSQAEMLSLDRLEFSIRLKNLLDRQVVLPESLGFLLTKDPSIPIRCVIADFGVTQGLMKTQPLVVDTTDTNIVGEGQINLRDETLDLRLTAHPKGPSLLSARAPLIVEGSFKDPTGYPDPKYLAAKAAVSVALGALLTPVAAIIPWIELGLGEDSQCQTLIAAAKENSAVAPRNKEE